MVTGQTRDVGSADRGRDAKGNGHALPLPHSPSRPAGVRSLQRLGQCRRSIRLRRDSRRLRTLLQQSPDRGVAVVEIGAELQHPRGIHERGLVDDEHRHRRRQVDAGGVAGRDALVDHRERAVHQQGGKIARVLHADAAMADAAVVSVEDDIPVRRVVQIDVEAVRHVEHDQAEPGIGAR